MRLRKGCAPAVLAGALVACGPTGSAGTERHVVVAHEADLNHLSALRVVDVIMAAGGDPLVRCLALGGGPVEAPGLPGGIMCIGVRP